MSHQVVYDGVPVCDAGTVHLKESLVQQHVEGLPPPRLPRVLVAAQARKDLRTGTETGQVVWAEREQWKLVF